MLSSGKHKEQALYDLVSGWRRGIFTAEEARRCGYSTQLVAHHVKAGNFVRLARGFTASASFPATTWTGSSALSSDSTRKTRSSRIRVRSSFTNSVRSRQLPTSLRYRAKSATVAAGRAVPMG